MISLTFQVTKNTDCDIVKSAIDGLLHKTAIVKGHSAASKVRFSLGLWLVLSKGKTPRFEWNTYGVD